MKSSFLKINWKRPWPNTMIFKHRIRFWEARLTFGESNSATKQELTRDMCVRSTTLLKRSNNSIIWRTTDNVSVKRLTIKYWLLRKNMKKTKTHSRLESWTCRASFRSVMITSLTRLERRVLVRKPTTRIRLSFPIQLLCLNLDLTVGSPTTKKSEL